MSFTFVSLSPSPGGRDYEIRTTDIISSDYEGSQPQDGLCPPGGAVQDSQESRTSSAESSQAATSFQTETHVTCTAPTDSAPPQQQHCSTESPSTSSNQGHSQALPAQGPPEAVAQDASQPQSQANGSTEPDSPQVNGSSPTREPPPELPKSSNTNNYQALDSSSSPSAQPASSIMEGSPVLDAPVPGFATLGRRLMLSGPHHPNHTQQHGPPQNHYPVVEHGPAVDISKRLCYSALAPQLHPSSHSNYSTISIPLPHPQPPLPEKRHPPAHSGPPSDGVMSSRPAVGFVPPSTVSPTQHHVTFSPTVGEIAPPAGQNDEVCVEPGNPNRVSVKFVQDSSRFWYKPGISREQGTTLMLLFQTRAGRYDQNIISPLFLK